MRRIVSTPSRRQRRRPPRGSRKLGAALRFLESCCLVATLIAGAAASSAAESRPEAKNRAVLADRIVAVVNEEVITWRELRTRHDVVERELGRQGTTLPPREVLEKQVLERMITDRVQLQNARESGVRIDDLQLDQALQRIAEGNRLALPDFRAALEKDGVNWTRFREDIRDEMTITRLREREVDQRMLISDSEIDAFLENEEQGGAANEEVELAHILVRVPESANSDLVRERRARAEEALKKLAAGDSFAQTAAAYSDAADGMQGGRLGARKLDRLPALYAEAVKNLAVGGVTPLLRSANGFHIVTVLSRQGGGAMPPVQQTRVRHILVRPSEILSEAEARHRLTGLRERLQNGAAFAELARLHSQDGSASKGGDLGWIYPGDTVPEFERAMDALAPGQISEPVQSPFGWHLIEVLERRVADVSSERRRLLARQALRERRSGEAYQDWIRQLRDRAYVETRLEEP